MLYNKHFRLENKHSFLSPSKHAWVHYDDAKLEIAYHKYLASVLGTKLHEFASNAIKLGIHLPEDGSTLSMYINDAIRFNMRPEQSLYYSDNCFGTCDCISFDHVTLRIHDLKTGESPSSFRQLEIYASLFCLEYDVDPNRIAIILQIYQHKSIKGHIPNPEEIMYIMEKIRNFDKRINQLKE